MNGEIWTMNADGTNQTGPLTEGANNSFMGDWSPDGTQLVFQSSRDRNFEVYKMNADGSNQINLTDNAATGRNNDSQPTWSPDGTRIAFQSDQADFPRPGEPRNLEIFTMKLDGSDMTQLTDNDYDRDVGEGFNLTGFDLNPSWSPDGTRIVFHSGRAEEHRDPGRQASSGSGRPIPWTPSTARAPTAPVSGGSPTALATTSAATGSRSQSCLRRRLRARLRLCRRRRRLLLGRWCSRRRFRSSVARVLRGDRQLSVLAPLTARASGEVEVEFFAAQRALSSPEEVDSENRRIRFERGIPAEQARLGTGIMTLTYPGDGGHRSPGGAFARGFPAG